MVANFLIGLREGLEAALVVGLVLAQLTRTGREELAVRVWIGAAIAAAVSLGVGAVLTFGPRGLSFTAQEAIGGSLSIVAALFVTWMVVWMARTSRSLRSEIGRRVDSAASGSSRALVMLVAFAVGREGLETSLFVWAAARAAGSSTQPFLGAVSGLVVAAALGALVHRGANRLDLGKFFRVTGFGLIVVAAGVFAYGVHDIQEAGILPGLDRTAFDVSDQVPAGSWYGTLLKGTINFSPRTTVLEAVAWCVFVVPVMLIFRRMLRPRPHATVSTTLALTSGR